jgi:hypothetical protein
MDTLRDAVARVRLFYDPTREPLRRRVYTYLLAVTALAVGAGLIASSVPLAIAGPLASLLAVPVVEKARGMVTPVADPIIDDTPGKHAEDRVR